MLVILSISALIQDICSCARSSLSLMLLLLQFKVINHGLIVVQILIDVIQITI